MCKNLYLCTNFIVSKMINRILLRIKVIQILYSYYKGEGMSAEDAEKELFISIERTYDLYFYLLQLVVEVTDYASRRIEAGKSKITATFEERNPQTKFIENKFAFQLKQNLMLKDYVENHNISWDGHEEMIKELYEKISESELYAEYMASPEFSYEKDKELWRSVFKRVIPVDEGLGRELEEISIYWNDDADTVVSFIIKTIKQFEEEAGENQRLQPMFKDDEDKEFVRDLLKNAIYHSSDYRALIDKHIGKNWDMERLAFMDIVIMLAALSELHSFPNIPINVTMNEFIEITKSYSTPKSHVFVNGILDSIVKDLRENKKLIKVAYVNR